MKTAILFRLLLLFAIVAKPVDARLKFSSKNSTIELVGAGTQLRLTEDITGWDGTLKIEDESLAGAAATINSDTGDKTITFDNGCVINGHAEALFTGVFDPNDDGGFDQIELKGNHRYRAEPGRILKKLEAVGQNNLLEGSPTFTVADHTSGGTPGAAGIFIVSGDEYGNDPGSLEIDVQSKLNTSIVMDPNTQLSLRDSLSFTNDAYVRVATDGDTANINLNEMEVAFGGGVSSIQPQVVNWRRNGKISFCSKVTLGGDDDVATQWRFRGSGGAARATYHINGHGNTLELGCNTTIVVDANTTLYLTDLKLKGLGRTGCDTNEEPTIMLTDCTSQVVYQNVTVEFAGPYTFDSGVHSICGPTTFFVCEHDVTFCDESLLVIDGETLWVDTGQFATDDPSAGQILFCNNHDAYLGCIVPSAILPAGSSHDGITNFLFSECGAIKVKCDCTDLDIGTVVDIEKKGTTINFNDATTFGPDNFTIVANATQTVVSEDNLYLAENRTMNIPNDTLIDGNGHAIEFAADGGPFITVQPGTTLTFSNVELRNFSPKDIQYNADAYGNVGRVLFGPKTVIDLRNPCDQLCATVGGVADSCITWTFVTDSTREGALIKGYGNTLDLNTDCPVGIYVDSAATLTLHNLRLRNLGGEQIDGSLLGTKPYNVQMADEDSRIVLKDTELVLGGNYSYTQGRFDVLRDATISGSYLFTQESPVAGGMTILEDSHLLIDRDTTYRYDAAPIADAYGNVLETLDDTRSKIVMTDHSSVFHLNGATLHSTTTGVKLANGTFLVGDKSFLTNDATNLNESAVLVIDDTNTDALCMRVLAGATLCVDGLVETR